MTASPVFIEEGQRRGFLAFELLGMKLEGANVREHWTKRHRRAAVQRSAACMVVRAFASRLRLPIEVTIVRLGRGLLDDDNAVFSAKFIRDGIADAFGVDDRDLRIRWHVKQERSKNWGVRIEVRTRDEIGLVPIGR